MDKKKSRLKRALKTRRIIKAQRIDRLTVFRTPKHIYAQVTTSDGSRVLASASTLQLEIKENLDGAAGNVRAAEVVGKAIADRSLAAGITTVAFDRSGFRYHGRVKALAEAARNAGLVF